MSIEVAIVVTVGNGEDERYVHVGRVESVWPEAGPTARPDDEQAVDAVDLARATLARLGAEALEIADSQIGELRAALEYGV